VGAILPYWQAQMMVACLRSIVRHYCPHWIKSRSKRTRLLRAGSGDRGQEGASDRRADLLAGCEQATGKTLLAPIHARRRTDRGGRQGQSYSPGGQ
jgi:hypothetical protein